MDISSEMIHSLLPLFLVGTLGASAFMVGIIEGLAEATGTTTVDHASLRLLQALWRRLRH